MEFFFSLITAAAIAQCPPVAESISAGKQALLEGLLDDSAAHIAAAESGLTCRSPPSTDEVGQFYLLRGAHHFFSEEIEQAEINFLAANKINIWDEVYGPKLHNVYLQSAEIPVNPISIHLKAPRQYTLYVDGNKQANTMQSKTSYHLIQVVDRHNNLYFSDLMYLEQSHQINIPKPAFNWTGPLLAAGGVCLLSTTAAILKNNAMRNATSIEELHTQYHQQKILTGISLGSGTVMLFTGAMHFIF